MKIGIDLISLIYHWYIIDSQSMMDLSNWASHHVAIQPDDSTCLFTSTF